MDSKNKLKMAIHKNKSFLCCGLDPDISKFPNEILAKYSVKNDQVFFFLKEIIDLTGNMVCSYKIQKAFFDILDNENEVLRNLIQYIHNRFPIIPVFIDSKIGDIGNTMNIYLKNLFDNLKADGITINPYMGEDIFTDINLYKDKLFIILILTSNPSATQIQMKKLYNKEYLWEHILKLSLYDWNKFSNIGIVLPSTNKRINFSILKDKIKDDVPILIAGYGAQGGILENIQFLLNKSKNNIFINSSRDILYCYSNTDINWRIKVKEKVDNINKIIQIYVSK
ncbi:MAG: orotidine-5'-phosphate decarboxylase [Patescibacteria group bacterium]